MKTLKRLTGLCVLVALGAALSACVVVPVPYGYGPYHHDHYRYGPR